MTDLLRAELLKLRSTRMVKWMAASTLGVVALNIALNILGAGRGDLAPLSTQEGVTNVFAAAGTGMTVMLVVGIMAVSGEFRHGTATSTFLAVPARSHVIAAKGIAAMVAGCAFATIAVAVTLAIAVPWLSVEDAAGADARAVTGVLAGSAFLTVTAGVLGVGFGALVRNQTVAVASALAWVLLVEALVAGVVPSVGRFLLSGVTASLVTAVGTPLENDELLTPPIAGAMVIVYTAAAVLLATRTVRRADI